MKSPSILQGIQCNLTLIPKSSHETDEPQQARLTTAFGIHFMDINNVSLRINALQMKNAFVTWRTLLAQIYRHLFFQVSPPPLPPHNPFTLAVLLIPIAPTPPSPLQSPDIE